MGIKQLFSIIKEEAPEAVKEGEIKNHFGRKVAIVSLSLAPVHCFSWLIMSAGCVCRPTHKIPIARTDKVTGQ